MYSPHLKPQLEVHICLVKKGVLNIFSSLRPMLMLHAIDHRPAVMPIDKKVIVSKTAINFLFPRKFNVQCLDNILLCND